MGEIFTLDDDVVDIMRMAISDLILYLGKNCKVVYPPRMVRCDNCVYDPIGKKSKNVYSNGGPIAFPYGSICPVCGGAGMTAAEIHEEIIRVIVHWNPKKYLNTKLDNVRLANGVISIKGHIDDMPKIRKMDYFVPHIELEGYGDFKFRLSGEPVSQGNIVQGKFFTGLLDRVPS